MTEVKFEPGSKEAQQDVLETMQRHHDLYVSRERAGQLLEEDKENFDLAMRREKKGQVQPLPEEPAPQPGE